MIKISIFEIFEILIKIFFLTILKSNIKPTIWFGHCVFEFRHAESICQQQQRLKVINLALECKMVRTW